MINWVLGIFRRAERSPSKGLAHVSDQLADAEVLILLMAFRNLNHFLYLRCQVHTQQCRNSSLHTLYKQTILWRESMFNINTYKLLKYAKTDYKAGQRWVENIERHTGNEQGATLTSSAQGHFPVPGQLEMEN